jgi:hypothetical protein
MEVALVGIEVMNKMLDAFIIEKIKKEEKQQWEPLPLTLELPIDERRPQEADEQDPKKVFIQIRF